MSTTTERRIVGIHSLPHHTPYKYDNGITKGWKIQLVYTDEQGDSHMVALNFRLKRDALAEHQKYADGKTPCWEIKIGLNSSGAVEYWTEEFGNRFKGVTL